MPHSPPPLPPNLPSQGAPPVLSLPPVLPAPPESSPPSPEPESFDEQPILRRKRPEAEMDMTPMVDVVFLLLIFFMITASFGMQKSIEMPSPESDQSSRETQTPEERDRADEDIVVIVTAEDRIFVEGDEATTPQELYARLREHRHGASGHNARHLLVLADPEAMHDLVVRVLDAGAGVGMDTIRLKTETGPAL